ncbi:carbamoyltransferase HypF [Candidatus Chlorohelix sp.]|uniref:carbamoyltransferase HypF n=1 Tax=Candidatus Chlorohelix sp. TaxID=3139201 RepID=UPI0030275BF6
MAEQQSNKSIERHLIKVSGIVQGVGFRPFVYSLALRLGLSGFVLNHSAGVTIEVEGEKESIALFRRLLGEDAPPLARINSIIAESLEPSDEKGFSIRESVQGAERLTLISPDTATCPDCLKELFDTTDRRYRYPFINCTNCGPRFTIVEDVPYDRAKTTMKHFPMCAECLAEYATPANRRFHAQPNACPVCGPQVQLLGIAGLLVETADPIHEAALQLANGAILAIKGLGGYHLACDAYNFEAVSRLRERKRREAKPFALMVRDLEIAAKLCVLDKDEAALLQSYRRPVTLLQQRKDNPAAPGLAPGMQTLGLMLPYTPLHYLLLHDFAAIGRVPALVMTSGNLSDEPIAYRDEEGFRQLSSLADGFLTHNRPIHMRCDDPVTRIVAGNIQFFRRSRGYAPEPINLSFDSPLPLLAVGAFLKNTFCLVKGKQAFISHHIGDLENLETITSFTEGIDHFKRLFDIEPEAVAYDLHPDFPNTRYALALEMPHKIGVQHHHAHIASVIAEHGLEGKVIGVAADGTGYGTDGKIWGGEIMVANLSGFERLAHLEYVPLPGGEQAVLQPWRMAAVYLQKAYGRDFTTLEIPFTRQLDLKKWEILSKMIERGLNSPLTSSLGRLFDAVAALVEIRTEVIYEGQAAIELEMLAERTESIYPFEILSERLDFSPVIRAIVEDLQKGVGTPQIAGRFHRTVTEMLAQTCMNARNSSGLAQVALSGGVFMNRLLLTRLIARLEELDFKVYINRKAPPNDGGLSFGQAAVAIARLREGLL